MTAVATLVGTFRLGRDVEVRTLADGEPTANLTLAYNWGRRDPSTGKRLTQWIEAQFWGRRVVQFAPSLVRGTLVWAVLDDVHVDRHVPAGAAEPRHKLAARVGRIEILSPRADVDDCELPAATMTRSARHQP